MYSRVELFERIRRDRRENPLVSQRELMKRHHVTRTTVLKALAAAQPPPRRRPQRSRPRVLEPVAQFVDEMLRQDLTAPRKQKHTVERICQRLAREHGFAGASYSAVRDYVAKRRKEIRAEVRDRAKHLDGNVPQIHLPGQEAEVDFHEVAVSVAGQLMDCWLFTLRLSFSAKAVHRVYASCGQEAFMEGHAEAFRVLGGVPSKHIRYDNLKPAVKQVLFGRGRSESQRWVAFRSHYGATPFYCLVGQEGAHEKGGVEHEGGWFRRNYLVPVVETESLMALNERLAVIDAELDGRHVHGDKASIGEKFAVEAPLLQPLPDDEFETGTILNPLVRNNSRVVVRQCYYSVPARFIGRTIRVVLRANEVFAYDGRHIVARHPRITARYDWKDELDHFLEILKIKPGALAGSTALAQARAQGKFTPAHDAFWAMAKKNIGDAEGTRALIDVLLLHRTLPFDAVVAGITAAVKMATATPDLVAIEARKAAETTPGQPAEPALEPAADQPDQFGDAIASQHDDDDGWDRDEYAAVGRSPRRGADVISLDERRALMRVEHQPPPLSIYDQLLRRNNTKGTA